MQTHDYTCRYWGHDYGVHKVISGGHILKVSGWGRGLVEGDQILLKNGDRSTSYRVVEIRYYSDPGDMWTATLQFWPRVNLAKVA